MKCLLTIKVLFVFLSAQGCFASEFSDLFLANSLKKVEETTVRMHMAKSLAWKCHFESEKGLVPKSCYHLRALNKNSFLHKNKNLKMKSFMDQSPLQGLDFQCLKTLQKNENLESLMALQEELPEGECKRQLEIKINLAKYQSTDTGF